MTVPVRPAFHEGQVLAAADLAATVGYARAAAARHARLLHDWGIADGLALTEENRTDPASGERFVEVTVQPGMAVDGTGREIVVPAPVVLSEADFAAVNGADLPTPEPYPVFLTAAERTPNTAGLTSCGVTGEPTRVEESYQILFGRLGDELLVAEQQPPPVDAAPAEPPARWLVLIGYVQVTDGHFTDTTTTARGVGLRFSGVRADTVSARSGTLTLRSRPTVAEGQPALVLSDEDPPNLVFGLYQGSGSVSPLMTVAGNGNLTVAGSISGRLSAGGVVATSGTATDGTLLPLPAGVSAEEVADGRVVLHIYVTPRIPPPPTATTLLVPVESAVDTDRRVRCRLREFDPAAERPGVVERPGTVDFLVLATGAATNGGG